MHGLHKIPISARVLTFLENRREVWDSTLNRRGAANWSIDEMRAHGFHNVAKSSLQEALRQLTRQGRIEQIHRSANRVAYLLPAKDNKND